jgi:hypothetical protein
MVQQKEVPEEYYDDSYDQPQIQDSPNAVVADVMREERVTNVLSQINPDIILEEIEHRIKGERKNRFTKQWEPAYKNQAPISDKLISNFMSFLGGFLTQNTSMSNFSEKEVNNIMENVIEFIGSDFYVNAEKYNLEGQYTEMSKIGNIICMSVFAVLKRAVMGTESKRIFNALKMNESMSPQQNQSLKDKLMETVKFW